VGFRFTLLEFFYKPGMCQVKLEWLFITQSAQMNHASVGNTGMCFFTVKLSHWNIYLLKS